MLGKSERHVLFSATSAIIRWNGSNFLVERGGSYSIVVDASQTGEDGVVIFKGKVI